MKKRIYTLVKVFIIGCLFYGCTKADRIDFIDNDAPAPKKISAAIQVTPTPGGAVLKFKLPEDPNLSYVKAIYEIQPGVFREAKSSHYLDTMSLVGFGDDREHQVQVFTVGKNEKVSEPVNITVKPLVPPINTSFETLNIRSTFGGVNVTFKNEHKADLAIVVIVDTTGKGTWATANTYHTGALAGSFSVRGYKPDERKFAVYLRDRWNNKSDTLAKMLTPLFETEIPKATFKAFNLPGDHWQYVEQFSMEKLWDGSTDPNSRIFASLHSYPLPQWFTIDLGNKVVISRFKEYQRPTYTYQGSAVKKFELWGSNDPDVDGGWTKWNLLGTFDSFKPSGRPWGQVTADDENYAGFLGEDFEFTDPPGAYRYIRFKSLENYRGGEGQITIAELTFWGQIQL